MTKGKIWIVTMFLGVLLSGTFAFAAKERRPGKGDESQKEMTKEELEQRVSVMADYRLRNDYPEADAYMKKIFDAHEKAFPGAFKHRNIIFYSKPERLSVVQQGALTELMDNPKFIDDWKSREPMTDLKFKVVEGLAKDQGPVADEVNLEAIRKGFIDVILYKSKKSFPGRAEDVVALLKENVHHIWSQRPKIFYSSEYEERLAKAMSVYVIAGSIVEAEPTLPSKELMARLSSLEVAALDYIKDHHNFDKFIERLNIKSDYWPTFFENKITRLLDEYHDHLFKKIYGDTDKKIELKVGEEVTLREVHPNICILRGYVGNDCSTDFSPGFVFTPYDRYYYAFDEKENVLGYVGLSIVSIDGEKGLFLHTIQGPDFSPVQTKIVMEGLAQSAKIFDAKWVVLGRDENISSNVNFFPISNTMKAEVADTPTIQVTWLDLEYRKIIHKWDSTMTYDDPERNYAGRPLPLDKKVIEVEAKTRPFKLEFERPDVKKFRGKSCNDFLKKSTWGTSNWSSDEDRWGDDGGSFF